MLDGPNSRPSRAELSAHVQGRPPRGRERGAACLTFPEVSASAKPTVIISYKTHMIIVNICYNQRSIYHWAAVSEISLGTHPAGSRPPGMAAG